MSEAVSKDKKYTYILIGIILVEVVFLICCFEFGKKSYHSDELWSYGIANSSDGPYIYMNNDESEFKNTNQWLDCSVLKDYITLDKSEIFNYKMVYENCAYDMHPPLYFMLLHLISSFFSGKFSKWFAFSISIFAFVLTQIFLYRLICCISKDKIFGILGVLYYGFTMGAVNDTIYLRNYSLNTAFIIVLAYYSTELYYHRDKPDKQWGYIIKSAIACLLGCLTVHFSLPAAFIITAMYCLYFLFSKNIKLMFKYGLSMAVSVGLSILLFWPTINHVFTDRRIVEGHAEYPAAWQFKIYWAYLQRDIIGFHNSVWPTMTDTYILLSLAGLVFLLIPICFIFRNEQWFKNTVSRIKTGIKTLWSKRKNFQYPILVLFVTVNFILGIASFSTSIFSMSEHARRYIFIIYPLYCCFILTFFYIPVRWIIKNNKIRNIIISLLLCITMVTVYVCRTDAFFFAYDTEGMVLDDIEDGSNIIIVLSSPFLLVCTTDKLMYGGHFYETNSAVFMDNDNYFDIDIDAAPLYLAIDANAVVADDAYELASNEGKAYIAGIELELSDDTDMDTFITMNDVLEFYEDLYGLHGEFAGIDSLFGRSIAIFRLE